MIVDLESDGAPDLLDRAYDVAIAGAGPAGIVLALRLSASGANVLLLEGGERDYTSESQDLFMGRNVGLDYFDLDVTRLRFLGGASNHWEGQCRHLDDFDFEGHAESGKDAWPIRKSDLDHYTEETFDILDLRKVGLHDRPIDGVDGFGEVEFFFSHPTRVGEKYERRLAGSDRVTLLLNASVTAIRVDPANGRVTHFDVRATNSGRPAEARAARYVLALGGLENPRLLLASREEVAGGVGNARDLVGRFFMEHPIFHAGIYVASPSVDWGKGVHYVATTAEETAANGGVNLSLTLTDYRDYPKKQAKRILCDYSFLNDVVEMVRGRKVSCAGVHNVAETGRLVVMSEQRPVADSRVVLSGEVDRLGVPRIDLDWRVAPEDLSAIRRTVLDFAARCADADIARLRLEPWFTSLDELDEGELNRVMTGGHHQMGTTRMGHGPGTGVVDADCRVFGHDNLYIAGSSVFTTGGYANPTFTLIQLALRLADRLAAEV